MLSTRKNMPNLHETRTCRFCKDEEINETQKHLMEECPEIKQKLGKHMEYVDIFKKIPELKIKT